MAARRVVAFPHDDNGLGGPTGQVETIVNVGEFPQSANRPKSGFVKNEARPRGIKRVEARLRALRAEAFCYVANDVHPDDLRQLCAAILVDLSAGQPPHTVYGDIREDARWWAGAATPVELQEYLSEALRALGKSALCLRHRKELFANLWESFPASDRRAFLARVDPDGKFRRGVAE